MKADSVDPGDRRPVQGCKTNETPRAWPIGKNVLWEYGGNVTLFAWQGDRWSNYGRVTDEA